MITFGVIDVGVKFIVTTQAPVPTTTRPWSSESTRCWAIRAATARLWMMLGNGK